jgi:hypothetical protein
VPPEVTVLDVVKVTAVQDIGWALALEFEHDEPAVVASSDEVDLRVRCKDPKAVLAPVREEMRALGGVPHSDSLVLAVTVKGIRVQDKAFSVVGIGYLITRSCLGRKSTLLTLLVWPRIESTSHACSGAISAPKSAQTRG